MAVQVESRDGRVEQPEASLVVLVVDGYRGASNSPSEHVVRPTYGILALVASAGRTVVTPVRPRIGV